jgi:hypothetical protein
MRLFILLMLVSLLCGCRLFSRPANNMNDPFVQEMMKNAAVKEIRFKGKIWRVCMKDSTYATIGETMYVDERMWKLSVENKAAIRLRSLIIHESMHTSRQLRTGVALWMICYFTSTTFRWKEEKAAYEVEWRAGMAAGETYTDEDYEFFAREVSGSVYHGMTTHDEAYKFMKETIVKLQGECKKK